MKIFENKNYAAVMYVLILVVTLLIMFNIVGILDDINKQRQENILTGYSIKESRTSKDLNILPKLYYGFFIIVLALIIIKVFSKINWKNLRKNNFKQKEIDIIKRSVD